MRGRRRWSPAQAHDVHRRIDDDLEHDEHVHHSARYDVDHDHGAFHHHHRPRRHHDDHSGHHDDRGPDDMGTAGRDAHNPTSGACHDYPAAGGASPTRHRLAVTWSDLGVAGVGLVVGYLLGRWRRRFHRIVIVVEAEP